LRRIIAQIWSRIVANPTALPDVKHDFDPRFWEVDLASLRVSHICGFSARVCSMPMTAAELRELNDSGLVAIGTARGDNGAKWAILANAEAIAAGERWWSSHQSANANTQAVSLLARHAGQAWQRATMPPSTVDIISNLRKPAQRIQ
jgi:hypothetical protein